ncbi:TVP38/TMEM64 family protein [Acaryochloris sp. IP29b_bin.137]|uniref:TVP38/TMEM64 family protein n=1 Tax=Acaryochloris sp. IP29b_bin.137 TaxID=2969217 RepID=UPI00261B0FBB|nr:TVP38/TMEM64 family protein [Acaryochloris sp. IP29b_bin.137]
MNGCSLALNADLNQKRYGSTSLRFWAVIALLVSLGALAMTDHFSALDLHIFTVEGFEDLVNRIGPWGPIAYIGLLIISVVASQIPGAPLAIAAGALWGPLTAGTYTIIGGFLGALLAYGLGKHLGQSFLQTLTGKKIILAPDLATNLMGWFILISRLLPVLSFDLVSYGAGMAGLSFPIYAIATLVGMTPSTFLLTYMGGITDPSQMLGLTGLLVVSIIVLPIVLVRTTGDRFNELIKIESA